MSDKLSSEQIEILLFLRSQAGCSVSRERFFKAFPKLDRKTYILLVKLGYLKVDSEADPISLTDSGKGFIEAYLSDKEEKQYQREYNADTLKTAQEANTIAKEANMIARDSNKLSKKAIRRSKISNWISAFALLASVIAILVSIFVR